MKMLLKRCLSLLLVISMLFTSNAIITFADHTDNLVKSNMTENDLLVKDDEISDVVSTVSELNFDSVTEENDVDADGIEETEKEQSLVSVEDIDESIADEVNIDIVSSESEMDSDFKSVEREIDITTTSELSNVIDEDGENDAITFDKMSTSSDTLEVSNNLSIASVSDVVGDGKIFDAKPGNNFVLVYGHIDNDVLGKYHIHASDPDQFSIFDHYMDNSFLKDAVGFYRMSSDLESTDHDLYHRGIDYTKEELRRVLTDWVNDQGAETEKYGTVYKKYVVEYDENLPSSDWLFAQGSRDFSEYTDEVAIKRDDERKAINEFKDKIAIKDGGLRIINSTDRKLKKIVSWNTEADGTGVTYNFNDELSNNNTDFQTENDEIDKLKLYAQWVDVDNYVFSVLYSDSGAKQYISQDISSDYAVSLQRIEDLVSDTHNHVKGFYASNTATTVSDDMKAAYDPISDVQITLGLKDLVSTFKSWMKEPTGNVCYMASYKSLDYKIKYDLNFSNVPGTLYNDNGKTLSESELIDAYSLSRDFSNEMTVNEYDDFDSSHIVMPNEPNKGVYLGYYYPGLIKCYEVIAWNTKADGTGKEYVKGEIIKRDAFFTDGVNDSLTLYAVWDKVKVASIALTNLSNYKKQYNVGECFDPSNLIFSVVHPEFRPGGTELKYNDALSSLFTFSPSLTTPLKETDTVIKVTLNDFEDNYGDHPSEDIPINVGTTYKIKYEKNYPSGNWTNPQSRISDSYDWDTDLSDSTTTMKTDETAFVSNMSVKGNQRWMINSTDTITGLETWKKLKEWNTKANGTGTRYTLGQVLNNKNNDFVGKTLTLYAIWKDVPIYRFNVLYKNGDDKELVYISSYDYTTYIDTILDGIPEGYDGFYDMGEISDLSENSLKNSYLPSTVGTLSKENVKDKYNEWITEGPNKHVAYGGSYEEKHFYIAYSRDGINKVCEDESGWRSDIDSVVSLITKGKLLGWYEIIPRRQYSDMDVFEQYDPSHTTDLITTSELKSAFSNWNSNKTTNKAYGASVSKVKSISVKAGTSLKTSYKVGETINPAGLVLNVTYDDNTEDSLSYDGNEVDFEFLPSLTTSLTISNTSVQVKYLEKTASYNITVTDIALTSIEISSKSTHKTTYIEGQKIDPTGLIINAKYEDNSETEITYNNGDTNFTFTPDLNTTLSTSNDTITFSYKGKSKSYGIKVNPKQVTTISVKAKTPNKVSYFVGDALDVKGLIINVVYDNGTSEEIPYNDKDFTFNPTNGSILNTVGTKKIEVSYKGKKTSYDINVLEVKITSISIRVGTGLKTSYIVGQNFDPTFLAIVAIKNNGSMEEIAYAGHESSFSFEPLLTQALDMTNTSVKIKYDDAYVTLPITVREKQVSGIELSNAPEKVKYFVGETIDPTGLRLKVLYDNGTNEILNYIGNQSKISFEPSLTEILESSDTEVKVSYEGKSAAYTINVTAPSASDVVLSGISIIREPSTKVYVAGQTLNPSGLVINVKYSNGEVKQLNYNGNEAQFIFTPMIGVALTISDNNVTVMFNGKTDSYGIRVYEPTPPSDSGSDLSSSSSSGPISGLGGGGSAGGGGGGGGIVAGGIKLTQQGSQLINMSPFGFYAVMNGAALTDIHAHIMNEVVTYSDRSNVPLKGFKKIKHGEVDDYYYFLSDSTIYCGLLKDENNNVHYFGVDGKMLLNQVLTLNGMNLEFNSNGELNQTKLGATEKQLILATCGISLYSGDLVADASNNTFLYIINPVTDAKELAKGYITLVQDTGVNTYFFDPNTYMMTPLQ